MIVFRSIRLLWIEIIGVNWVIRSKVKFMEYGHVDTRSRAMVNRPRCDSF